MKNFSSPHELGKNCWVCVWLRASIDSNCFLSNRRRSLMRTSVISFFCLDSRLEAVSETVSSIAVNQIDSSLASF